MGDDVRPDYDVIVIGSGIGGLAAASLLAAVARKRVLVVERHFRLGGTERTRGCARAGAPLIERMGFLAPSRPSVA